MSFLDLCSIFSPFCCVLRGDFPGQASSRNLCVKALRKGMESSLSCISSYLLMSTGEAVRIWDGATIESPLSSVSWPKHMFPSGLHTCVKCLLFLGKSGRGHNAFIVHQADFMDVWKKNQTEMLTNDAFVMLFFSFHFQTLSHSFKLLSSWMSTSG